MISLSYLIDAAKEARIASTDGKAVELIVLERGVVVRGVVSVGGRQASSTASAGWREMSDANFNILACAVRSVADDLNTYERQMASRERRG